MVYKQRGALGVPAHCIACVDLEPHFIYFAHAVHVDISKDSLTGKVRQGCFRSRHRLRFYRLHTQLLLQQLHPVIRNPVLLIVRCQASPQALVLLLQCCILVLPAVRGCLENEVLVVQREVVKRRAECSPTRNLSRSGAWVCSCRGGATGRGLTGG